MTLADYEILEAPAPFRWTVEEFFRASDEGFFDGKRVELIEGDLFTMPPQNNPHAWTISRLNRILNVAFPDPFWLKIQATLVLGKLSAPEPDFTILSGPPVPPAEKEPRTLLVIEVSESTLRYDRKVKASLYASKQIADYWVVDVAGKQVLVHREPVVDPSQKFGWRYDSVMPLGPGDDVIPLAKTDVRISVASFLS